MSNGISRSILLVEDNPDDVTLTMRAFTKNKIANPIVVAKDGIEALDYLLARGDYADREPGLPVLILLDLQMPRLDGLEVLRTIRNSAALRTLPVVIMTSSRAERDVLESYQLGANGYVQKPVDLFEFLDAIRVLGLYWLVLNIGPPAA